MNAEDDTEIDEAVMHVFYDIEKQGRPPSVSSRLFRENADRTGTCPCFLNDSYSFIRGIHKGIRACFR